MIAFMLAAGLGTRLRPYTDLHPKPCIPFLNVPMGLYHFRYLNHLPVDQLVVNTHHLPEQVVNLYQNQPYFKKLIQFSNENEKILGSAGGLKKASVLFKKEFLQDQTVLLMNADEVLFESDSQFLLKAYQKHIKNKNFATLVTMKHPEAGKKFGAIWCNHDCVSIVSKTAPTFEADPYHFIGMIFLHADVLKHIPENQETNIFYDILNPLLADHKVEIYNIDCQWFETGHVHDYSIATKEMLKKINSDLLNFINSYDPSELFKTSEKLHLVSKSKIQEYSSLNPNISSDYFILSKTTDPNVLKHLDLNADSVVFDKTVFKI